MARVLNVPAFTRRPIIAWTGPYDPDRHGDHGRQRDRRGAAAADRAWTYLGGTEAAEAAEGFQSINVT